MAIGPEQGIMALPENQGMQAPQLSMMDSYDAMQQGLKQARPDAHMEMREMLDELRPALDELTDEQLGLLIQAIQDLYGDPQNYQAKVQELVKNRFIESADELPPEYDEQFIATLLMVLIDVQQSRQQGASAPMPQEAGGIAPGMMPPPQQFARGGIAEAARIVAQQGRNGDTMLAHITPEEARFLRARGGSGTINPVTGLPEFWPLLSRKRGIGKTVSKALSSPVGRILGTIALGMVLGPAVGALMPGLSAGMAAGVTGALSSGLVTAATGGDLKSILTSAATGFLAAPGGPVGNWIGKYTAQVGITNAAAQAAITGAVTGTGAGLISGQNLKESLKAGLTQGIISGGLALATGAKPIEAEKAAQDASTEATSSGMKLEPLESASLEDMAQASAAKAGSSPNYVPTTDANGNLGFYDRFNGNKFIPANSAEAKALGLGTPQYDPNLNAPGKDIFAQKPGMSQSQLASQNLTAAKSQVIPQGQLANLNEPSTNIFAQKAGMSQADYARKLAQADAASFNSFQDLTSVDQARKGLSDQTMGLYDRGRAQSLSSPSSPSFMDKVEGLYDKYLSPAERGKAGMAEAQKAYSSTLASTGSKELAMKAYDAAMPGVISTYGPITAAGIGTLYAAGAFKTPEEEPLPEEFSGPTGQELLRQDPNKYLVQGLPGVQYDSSGNITGRSAFGPSYSLSDVRVASNYPSSYSPQRRSGFSGFFADGGIAALAQGGYPRMNGQINGPGTEKSDSIPAMLSDGEFVMTAKAVRGAGGGSRREGAKRMYALMHQLERNAARG